MSSPKSISMAQSFLDGEKVDLRKIDAQVKLENFKNRLDRYSFGHGFLKAILAPVLIVGTFLLTIDHD